LGQLVTSLQGDWEYVGLEVIPRSFIDWFAMKPQVFLREPSYTCTVAIFRTCICATHKIRTASQEFELELVFPKR
jgi:hypothetical protein